MPLLNQFHITQGAAECEIKVNSDISGKAEVDIEVIFLPVYPAITAHSQSFYDFV